MKCINCGCDPDVLASGIRTNRRAWLGSQIVSLREYVIPQLEKEARRTPPKTLIFERAKVEAARRMLPLARSQLESYLLERESLA